MSKRSGPSRSRQDSNTSAAGEPAFDQVYGTSVYQYLSGHPDQASLFGAAAAGFHAQASAQIAGAHDFSGYGTMADRFSLIQARPV